jgi:hypothetical protein
MEVITVATAAYRFDNEQIAQNLILSELDEKSRALFDQICDRQCGLELLRFLSTHANSLHTIEDIAFYVGKTYAEAECGLSALLELGFARRLDVMGLSFFGALSDPVHAKLVSSFFAWQDRWCTFIAKIARVDQLLDVKGAPGITLNESPAISTPRLTSYVD